MRHAILVLLLFQLFPISGIGQGLNAIYPGESRSKDSRKIANKFGGLSSEYLSQKELISFLEKEAFTGDALHDSIVVIRLNENYYYTSGDAVGAIHNWLKLLSTYSGICTEEDLEFANRKVAEAYFVSKNYVLAREFFHKTLEFDFAATRAYVQARIGSTYLQTGDVKSAIPWYQKSVKASISPVDKVAQRNSLGYVYYLDKNYPLAEKYLNEAKTEYFKYQNKTEEIQFLIVKSNMSSLYLARDEHEKCLNELFEIIEYESFLNTGSWFTYEVYSKIIGAYFYSQDCANAEKYLVKLESTLPANSLDPHQLSFIKTKIKWLSKCRGGQGISELFDLYVSKEDSVRVQDNVRNDLVQKVQRTVYNDQIELVSANLKLKEESEDLLTLSNTRLVRLFLISGVLFLVVVFFFILRFRKNKLKQDLVVEKERSTDLQIKMAEQEMANKKLELSKILATIDRTSSLSDEVLSRLTALKSKEGDVKEDISQIIQFINSMSRSNHINELVEKNSDVLGFGLKERLEKTYPTLTPSELQLIILIRIGLSTKEIAQLRNVEPSSVRIFKHRLKTKLDLSKETDLAAFIQEI